ncbi:MAG TPA: HEAT repeat domain-containing protein, partial [Candidatus Manganitrophaceae bacterium]|nr:HEAT repeat domain-containing protein [Candidatus Manganitrophaceae bacterium]
MILFSLLSPKPGKPASSPDQPSSVRRRTAGPLVLLFAAGIALAFSGCSKPADKELAEAQSAYEKQDYNRALALSDAALQKNPGSLPAHKVRVLSYMSEGSVEAAFNDYDAVEKKYPEIAPQLLREISVGTIQKSMTHENYFVRSAAVKAVGEMGDPALAALIIPGLKDSAPFVRFFTVESLGQLGGPDALKLLLAAGKDPDGMVRVAAVKTLDEMADDKSAGTGGVEIKNVLAAFTADSDITVRLFALAAMAKRGDQAAFSQLLEVIRGLPPQARAAGAAALGRSKNKEAVPLLITLIGDSDGTLRMYAAEAMGEIPAPELFAPLSKAIADADPAVRGAAATSLGKQGDPKAVPLLTQALQDSDAIVRVSAAEGLQRLGKKEPDVYK